LLPYREIFRDTLKIILWMIVDIVVSSFKSVSEIIIWSTKIFTEIIDFINNVFHWDWESAFNNLANIVIIRWETVINVFEWFGVDLPAFFENLRERITNIRDWLFSWLKNICSSAIEWISNKIQIIWNSIAAARDAITSLWWWDSVDVGWWRASWWTVLAGRTYRVNEIKGEYFTPSTNWTISAGSPNWSFEVNISFWNVILNNWEDENQFADRVREVMVWVFKNKALWSY
jgi:hypothetical protein